MSFHDRTLVPAALNRHAAISFQSGAVCSMTDMIPAGNYFGVNSPVSAAMVLSGNTNMVSSNPSIAQASCSTGSLQFDSAPAANYEDASLAEWSVEEQYTLEEGLIEYANEQTIMKYVKVAAKLPKKTVRDVAIRCRWKTRKRRKPEDYAGKRVKDRKDKLVGSSTSKIDIPSVSSPNMVDYSFMMHQMDQNDRVPYEVSGAAKQLLEQNAQVFDQITANFSSYELRDNIDLFRQTRNNITAILKGMREMPGIMSQMPPLPVWINENLADSILPNTTHAMMLGSPTGIPVKPEPRF